MSAAQQDSPLLGISQREPPNNTRAEQSLLGAILANPRAFDRVAHFLRPEHFADPLHGRIYGECARLIVAGKTADPVVLRAWFEHQDHEGFGPEYLASLLGAMVGVINAGDYGMAIFDAWARRQIIDAAEVMVNQSFSGQIDAKEIVAQAMDGLERAMLRDANSAANASTLDQAMSVAMERAEAAMTRQGPAGISTGMSDVDRAIGGLEDGTFTVLGGRPGMGKTALATGWELDIARHQGPIAVFSLEMSAPALARRCLASAAGVSVEAMKAGRLSSIDVRALKEAESLMRGLPLYFEDGAGVTPSNIALKARMLKRKYGIKALAVDHMHIVRSEKDEIKHGPTYAVGQTSLALMRIAKDLNIPVLALAQLNRGPEEREDKRPTLMDLKQSGDIEQNADTIMFVYRPEYYLKNAPETHGIPAEKAQKLIDDWNRKKAAVAGHAELICAKVRDGEPQTVNLRFNGAQTRFYQLARIID